MGLSHGPAHEQISTKTDAEFLDSPTEKACIPVVLRHHLRKRLQEAHWVPTNPFPAGAFSNTNHEPFNTEGSGCPSPPQWCSLLPRFLSLWDSQVAR